VSKSNNSKILYWFGICRPSKKAILHEERRVHYHKNFGSLRTGLITVKSHLRFRKGKKIIVAKHTKLVRKHPTINKELRQHLNYYSKNKPREFGGALDFNKKGNLERYTVNVGRKEEIPETKKLNQDLDYESTWHTHPTGKEYLLAPSNEDIRTLMQSRGSKASLILQNNKAIVIIKTPEAKKWYKKNKKNLSQAIDQIDKQVEKSIKGKESKNLTEKKFLQKLKNEGFKIVKSDKGAITLPIKTYEPK